MIWLRESMRQGPTRRALNNDDAGSALILALIFVLVVFLGVTALLSFTEVNLLATTTLHDQGKAFYGVDAAVEGAINNIRGNVEAGRFGGSCPTFNANAGGTSVEVTCEALDGSGVDFGLVNRFNRPDYAILTLGNSTDGPGIQQKSGSKNLSVTGDIWSRSSIISSTSAKFTVNGNVTGTACDSNIIVPPPFNKRCPNAGAPAIADPNYAIAGDVPGPAPAPNATGCSSSPKLVKFFPGRYTSPSTLDAAFKACDSTGTIYWFTPGTSGPGLYYFDFDGELPISVAGIIVGGEPTSPLPAAGVPTSTSWSAAHPFPALPIPPLGSRCNFTNSSGAVLTGATGPGGVVHGVQFIFGGESRLKMQGGDMELCPEAFDGTTLLPYDQRKQQIAVYGAKTTAANSRQQATTSSTVVAFTNPSNAFNIDTLVSTATITSTTGAAITLAGYGLVPAPIILPPTNVTLRLSHSETESGANSFDHVSVTVTPGGTTAKSTFVSGNSCGSTPLCTNGALSRGSSLHEDSIDLSAILTDPVKINLAQITYAAFWTKGTVTEKLDGAVLDVTTGYRGQSGCITAVSGTQCDVISGSGAAFNGIVSHGTIYVPSASVDIQITNLVNDTFRRGAVLRQLKITKTNSSRVTGPAVDLPPLANGRASRKVFFEAKVAGVTKLRAIAEIFDRDITNSTSTGGSSPGFAVKILAWSFVRPEAT